MTLSDELKLEMWRRVLLIRRFEETVIKLQQRGQIFGAVHTSIGQEAEIVGSCLALQPDDYMVGNHRSHGHPLAKGADPAPLLAELFGKVAGVNHGKGGSMHLADFSVGSLGETSIVGSGMPVAAGAALAAKMMKDERVCLCFFGDGAANEGTFHESMNLASIWDLPVIWLCENNLYGSTTPISTVCAVPNIADRAGSYAIPGITVDGQDVVAVYEAVAVAAERARRDGTQTLVEAKTYRYDGHAAGTGFADGGRDVEEVQHWRDRDPVKLLRERLANEIGDEPLGAIEREVESVLEKAVEFAKSSPSPDPSEAFEGVFA